MTSATLIRRILFPDKSFRPVLALTARLYSRSELRTLAALLFSPVRRDTTLQSSAVFAAGSQVHSQQVWLPGRHLVQLEVTAATNVIYMSLTFSTQYRRTSRRTSGPRSISPDSTILSRSDKRDRILRRLPPSAGVNRLHAHVVGHTDLHNITVVLQQ